MRSVIAAVLLFLTFAFASETVYTTRTVYRVVTETQTGVAPTSIANSTSVITASYGTIMPTGGFANVTAPTVGAPSATGGLPTQPSTGAAASFDANSAMMAAVLAIGGLMAL